MGNIRPDFRRIAEQYYSPDFAVSLSLIEDMVAKHEQESGRAVEDLATFSALMQEHNLTIPSLNTAWPHHFLEVIVKATSNAIDRWNTPLSTVIFTGLTLSSGSSISAPVTGSQQVLFFGDSITEGGATISVSEINPEDEADVTIEWSFLQQKLLGVEVGIVGFSRQGWVETGLGNVPAFPSTWNSLWSGQARSFSPAPNLIVINQGTNDTSGNVSGLTDAQVISAVETTLTAILAATPSTTKIAVMRPFNGNVWADIQTAVAAVNSPRITLINTTGFQNVTDSADGLHPLGVANLGTIAPLVAAQLKPLLAPAGRSYSFY